MQQYIDLTVDFAKRNDRINGITLDRVTTRSYDTAIKFRIEIVGHALDDTYDVKILSKYHTSDFKTLTTLGDRLEVVDGKLIYTPKVNLITEADYARNYLYLSKDGLGLDMAQFNYQVDVSQIGEAIVEFRQAYDESYETLLAEFEQALEDYKLTLPQADSMRAEIDVVLNQFGVDSQAKLSQYDTDAQQVIADNQTAFSVAESGRQDTYEQAEDNRNQASNQVVVDWEQGADALLEVVEDNESVRVDAEANRKTAETDRVSSEATRKTNETIRISNEDARKSAEVIRLASEVDRVNAETVRVEFYEGFDGRLVDLEADKVVLKNLIENGDFTHGTDNWYSFVNRVQLDVENNKLLATGLGIDSALQVGQSIPIYGNHIYYVSTIIETLDSFSATYINVGGHHSAGDPGTQIVRSDTLNQAVGLYKFSLTTPQFSGIYSYLSVNIYCITESAEASIGKRFTIEKPVVIDLTETFGAGNEPIKEEMDEFIKGTGYIGGEYALNNKEMLGRLMNGIREKADKKQEDWITPTLLNGWVSEETNVHGKLRYRKDNFNKVTLSGSISNGSATTICTLPIGYRPYGTVPIIAKKRWTHGGYDWLEIRPTGELRVSDTTLPTDTRLFFEITYYAN